MTGEGLDKEFKRSQPCSCTRLSIQTRNGAGSEEAREEQQGLGKALRRPELQEAGGLQLTVEAGKPRVPALGTCFDNCHLAEDPETGEGSRKTPSQERRNPKEN